MSREINNARFFGDFITASGLYLHQRDTMPHSDAIPFENMELGIAENMVKHLNKIDRLSESGAKQAAQLANLLERCETCSVSNSEDKKNPFIDNMLSSYYTILKSGHKLDKADDFAMLKFTHELAINGNRERIIGGLFTNPGNEKVAGQFLKFAEEDLNRIEDKGQEVFDGDAVIGKFTEIVALHPSMDKKCRELIDKTLDLQGNDCLSNAYDAASNYFNKVQETDGISFEDKRSAGMEKMKFGNLAKRAKRMEVEKSKEKTMEFDFGDLDFEMEM